MERLQLICFSKRSKGRVDLPDTGGPGPERTVYHLPVGFGVDVAFDGCWSAFAEASYRWDLNYVWKNEREYDPHNTSLVMGGIRGCLKRKPRTAPPPAPIPPPLTVPGYDPPLPRVARVCTLIELNSVYFAENVVDLSNILARGTGRKHRSFTAKSNMLCQHNRVCAWHRG